MKPRHTLGMFIALLILCALYYGLQFQRARQVEEKRVAAKVFAFSPEDIQTLSLEQVGAPVCMAERIEGDQWRMTKPDATIPPFHMMWSRVAQQLSGLSNEHTVLDQLSDPAAYGLELPMLTVSAVLRDSTTHVLKLGDLEPTQRHRYAQLDDGALFLVTTDAFFELNRSLLDLRHRFLVDDREKPLLEMEFAWIWPEEAPQTAPSDNANTDSISVESGRGRESMVVVVKRDAPDASWRMVAPVEGPANHETVNALAEELQFAVGNDFIDAPESLRDYGLQPARARIAFSDAAGGKRQTLWVGGLDETPEKTGVFVQREGENTVRLIGPNMLGLFPKTPVEWRDLRLLTRRISDINRVEFSKENDRFVLEKDAEGRWKLTEPVLERVNPTAVSGYLAYLKDVAGTDFAQSDAVHKAIESPVARLNLRYDDEATAEVLIARCPEETPDYIASQDTGGIVVLSDAAARMLLTDSSLFVSRELLRFNKADVVELSFVVENVAYHLKRREGRWAIVEPATATLHNQSDVDTFLSALSPLSSEQLVAPVTPDDLSPYGLDAPAMDIRMALQSADAPVAEAPLSLSIGASHPENHGLRYARVSTREGIHLIKQEVMDELREALKGIRTE